MIYDVFMFFSVHHMLTILDISSFPLLNFGKLVKFKIQNSKSNSNLNTVLPRHQACFVYNFF